MICVVIPAYNEGQSIGKVVASVSTELRWVKHKIIVIDDGSTDDTSVEAVCWGAWVMRFQRNWGKAHALRTGITEALTHNPERIMLMDADGQHDAGYIRYLARCSVDVTIGRRVNGSESTTLFRRVGISLLSTLTHLITGRKIADVTSGMRALSPRAARYLAQEDFGRFPEVPSLVGFIKSGFSVQEYPVRMHQRSYGTSHVRAFRFMADVFFRCLCTAFMKKADLTRGYLHEQDR